MGWEPGGAPPPPPPVPSHGSPPAPRERPPQSTGPGRPPRARVVAVLAVALAIALAGDAITALQLKQDSDDQAAMRAQIARMQDEIDTLRRQEPTDATTILGRIAAAVEQIRRLRFLKTVKPEFLTDDELAARVEQDFRATNPRAKIEQTDAVLTALGLLAPRDDLYDIDVGIVREQVAGFYDSHTGQLVVGGDGAAPSPLDQVLLAHEYVHALTDQHYSLNRLDALDASGKDDEAEAFRSLIEGDATVMMFQYAQKYLTPSDRAEVSKEADAAPSQRLESAPKALREALLFPYNEGRQFVQSLIDAGGISALNKAYRDPPTSTEQILHVDKYLATPRDEPKPVQVPKLAATMGAGWTDLPGGGVGELDVRLIVDQFLSSSDGEAAGSGWGGGRYAAAESQDGTVVAALTDWDSVTEAREAADIFARWLPARYGNQGSDFRVSGATGRGWTSSAGAGSVTRNGTRLLLILGPDQATVAKARTAFPGL